MSGTCHRPQITPLTRMGRRGTPASIIRVSMYPRQPISSPAAETTLVIVPMVAAQASMTTKIVMGEAVSPTNEGTNPAGYVSNRARPVVHAIP